MPRTRPSRKPALSRRGAGRVCKPSAASRRAEFGGRRPLPPRLLGRARSRGDVSTHLAAVRGGVRWLLAGVQKVIVLLHTSEKSHSVSGSNESSSAVQTLIYSTKAGALGSFMCVAMSCSIQSCALVSLTNASTFARDAFDCSALNSKVGMRPVVRSSG
jgi:hypothetical protein